MAKKKITISVVNALKKHETVWDTTVAGFGVRRQKGNPRYIIKCRVNGEQVWSTIGPHGTFTPDQARREARLRLADAQKGIHPNAAKKAAKAGITLAEAAERLLSTHTRKKSKSETQKQYNRILNSIVLPKLGKKKLRDISLQDIERLHSANEGTPYQANRMLAILSKLFNLAEKWGERDQESNPCRHIDKFTEKPRERYLDGDELQRLAATLGTAWLDDSTAEIDDTNPLASPSAVAAIWLLLLTGARLNEVLTLKWDYLNADHSSARLPDSKTGTKTIHFSAPAQQIIHRLPKIDDNPYIIVGRKPAAHIVNLQKPWQRIRDAAGLEDVRIHDLRHTYASYGAMEGLSGPILMKLLGHSQPITTKRYLHLQDEMAQKANAEVGEAIFDKIKNNKK